MTGVANKRGYDPEIERRRARDKRYTVTDLPELNAPETGIHLEVDVFGRKRMAATIDPKNGRVYCATWAVAETVPLFIVVTVPNRLQSAQDAQLVLTRLGRTRVEVEKRYGEAIKPKPKGE